MYTLDLMEVIGHYNVAVSHPLEGGDKPSDFEGIGLTDELKEGAGDNWLTAASSIAEETAVGTRNESPHCHWRSRSVSPYRTKGGKA